MNASDELLTFISTSFRSVWALEILLLLKREERPLSTDEVVTSLRASTAVVHQTLGSLAAGGLVELDGNLVSYQPVTSDISALVDAAEAMYATRPDRVRRTIIASANRSLIAFSDAFRLKD